MKAYLFYRILTGIPLLVLAGSPALAITPQEIENLAPRSPLPTPNDLAAIVADGNTVVAIANTGEIGLSRDSGNLWIPAPRIEAVQSFNPPQAITTDGIRYVAVALGKWYLSTDLETWINGNLAAGNSGYDVAFGNGRFVSVGTSGSINRSLNGESWTVAAAVPTSENLTSVAFGGGVFVAGGAGGQLLSSPDGDTWTLRLDGIPGATDARENTFTNVSFANSLFHACAYDKTLYTSPDGLAWTARDLSGFPLSGGPADVVHDGARYVLTGGFGGSVSSPDLATFTELESNASTRYLAETGGTVITVGNSAYIGTLGGGTNWIERSGRLGEHFNSVVFGDGQFIIADSSTGRIFTSRTGVLWTFVFEASSNFRSGIAMGGGRYVVMIGNDEVATSTDGTNWTQTTHDAGGVVDGLIFLNDHFLLYGRTGNLYTSQDGVSWTKRTIPGDYWPEDIAFGNGIYAIVGNSGDILTSSDLATWTPRATDPSLTDFVAVEFVGGRFVAQQRSKKPAVSSDGLSWALDSGGAEYHLSSSGSDPDLGLYTFGTTGSIRYHSDPSDLSTVETVSYPAGLRVQGLAEGNGTVVLVGDDGLILSTAGDAAGYEGWVLLNLPLDAPVGTTGPNDDYDHDGNVNLIEYARGTDPQVVDPPFAASPERGTFGPELTWTQRENVSGFVSTLEYSSSLGAGSWSTTGVLLDSTPTTGGMESVTARVTGAPGAAIPLYLRIRWTLE